MQRSSIRALVKPGKLPGVGDPFDDKTFCLCEICNPEIISHGQLMSMWLCHDEKQKDKISR